MQQICPRSLGRGSKEMKEKEQGLELGQDCLGCIGKNFSLIIKVYTSQVFPYSYIICSLSALSLPALFLCIPSLLQMYSCDLDFHLSLACFRVLLTPLNYSFQSSDLSSLLSVSFIIAALLLLSSYFLQLFLQAPRTVAKAKICLSWALLHQIQQHSYRAPQLIGLINALTFFPHHQLMQNRTSQHYANIDIYSSI